MSIYGWFIVYVLAVCVVGFALCLGQAAGRPRPVIRDVAGTPRPDVDAELRRVLGES